MNRLQIAVLLSSALGMTAFACGGISDPTRDSSERVATVSGALTGTSVPANARVALVYRRVSSTPSGSGPSVEVASDVPVVGGKFSMNLAAPAASYLTPVESHSFTSGSGGVDSPPPSMGGTPEPAPAPDTDPSPSPPSPGGGGAFAGNVGTRDIVSGGITEAMTGAIAGFIVYADANGNGKLDLEGEYASTPDTILGGNTELALVYLKDGGALDYEKMRDKSGILPTAGFNLAWAEGRWLPLNVVELKLSASTKLPALVCSTGYGSSGSSGSLPTTEPAPIATSDAGVPSDGGAGGYYPDPSDPNLHCSPDGRSFSYSGSVSCPPPQPPAVGLCAPDGYDDIASPCARGGWGSSIPYDAPVPPGWPCATTVSDGGGYDSGTDGGSYDGGGADAGVDGG